MRRVLSSALILVILRHDAILVDAGHNSEEEQRLKQPSSSSTPTETLPIATQTDAHDHPQTSILPELLELVGISDYDPFAWEDSDEACDALYHQHFIDTLPARQWKWSINRERWPVESFAANWQHYTLRGRACVFSCRMLRYSTDRIKDLRENLRLNMIADKSKFEKLVIKNSFVYASSHQKHAVTAKCFREIITKSNKTRKRKRHVSSKAIQCLQSGPTATAMPGLSTFTEFGSTSRSPQRRRETDVESQDRPFYMFLSMTVTSPNASPGREPAQLVSELPPGMTLNYKEQIPAQATVQVCGIGTSTIGPRGEFEDENLDLSLRLWSGNNHA